MKKQQIIKQTIPFILGGFMQYRQGDVLIERISELPRDLKTSKRDNGKIILAYGESTGHSHVIADKEAKSFIDNDGNLFLSISVPTDIEHEEHAIITIPPGIYRVTHQREYSPEEIRNVGD